MIDDGGSHIGNWIIPYHDEKALSFSDYIPQETLFWRRSAWEKIGAKLDESFSFAFDWDLLLRLRDSGATFMHVPLFIACFRVHIAQKSLSQIQTTGIQEMTIIRERLHGRDISDDEIKFHLKEFYRSHSIRDLLWRVKTKALK